MTQNLSAEPVPIYRERISRCPLSTYLSYATGWNMRVWREERLDGGPHREPGRTTLDADIVNTLARFTQLASSPLEIAKTVLELPRINAVEITDFAGHGEVLYKDWP